MKISTKEIAESSSKLLEKVSAEEMANELLGILRCVLESSESRENVEFFASHLPCLIDAIAIFVTPELLRATKNFLKDERVERGENSILSGVKILFELSDAWPVIAGVLSPLLKEALEDRGIKDNLANIIESLGVVVEEGKDAILLKMEKKSG
jgi:hypothetical protein